MARWRQPPPTPSLSPTIADTASDTTSAKVCGILFDAATFPIAQANDSAEMAGVAISHDKRRMTFADGVSKILRT
jgi:hypothetical protein